MKGVRLLRWSGSVLSPRIRPQVCCRCSLQTHFLPPSTLRTASTAAAIDQVDDSFNTDRPNPHSRNNLRFTSDAPEPSPLPSAALRSAKLSALHSRLSLSKRFPLQTLARTLVDASADRTPTFNNASLAVLGNDLLSYYTSEHLICQYPRIPMTVLFAAMHAYIGSKSLASIAREWGTEAAAAPGNEVDPGYLQFQRLPPDVDPDLHSDITRQQPNPEEPRWKRGVSSRILYDDQFGDIRTKQAQEAGTKGVTLEHASNAFVRAVMGAVYLHGGRKAAKHFFQEHFMSRQLDINKLFDFRQPTRDLSRLCAREGFESPVARIVSETGRKSRHPVFVVGVYSGKDKLGEGSGASLDEARTRAAVAALKGWYLYSPMELRVPSEMEEAGAKEWEPVLVDYGEIVA